ncbi:MAG: glycoside hydrolase family 140 protein [Chitinophagaceae bacterium]
MISQPITNRSLVFQLLFLAAILCTGIGLRAQEMPLLQVSANKRFFQTSNGKPFFWLGDTGWLLFHKTTRKEAGHYLDVRKAQGFNVIQVMVIHSLQAKNIYGSYALNNSDLSQPVIANNTDTANYWNHISFIIEEAAKRNIYLALVPVWGGDVRGNKISAEQATVYAKFLADRFGKYNNIIWLNGGDTKGTDGAAIWQAIGTTLRKYDTRHLISFHPRGRYSSSEWFHEQPWLDFNMFQSGHRTYAQDTSRSDKYHFGEDNWRYIQQDYALNPAKPTLDGEPSYENIPHGLHDSLQPRWNDADLRRYAYWSVFAGGAGFTYGENATMQFHKKGDADRNYGVTDAWTNTIYSKGATQLHYLKALLLSLPYFERIPAQNIIAGEQGSRYDFLIATKGKHYALVYTYSGKNFSIDTNELGFVLKKAQWFSPSTGKRQKAVFQRNGNQLAFDPPGTPANGNDWVLIMAA